MLQVIGRALGMFLITVCLLACVLGPCFYMLHLSEEADFKFEIRMGKDINRIARELKNTGMDDRTVEILEYALRDVQRNTQSYVSSKASAQSLPLMGFGPMIEALGVYAAFSRKAAEQKRPPFTL